MNTAEPAPKRRSPPDRFELLKLKLERARYRTELVKWVMIALGATASFLVIDYGKLRLERFRVSADSQRQLVEAYLKATESEAPEIWKRKLHVLRNFAGEAHVRGWAEAELRYIEDFAALDALYRETLRTASQLVEPGRLADPERVKARVRFNELYWADLPYAGEDPKVIAAMIGFRNGLLAAEGAAEARDKWDELNVLLIGLSQALRASTPKPPSYPAARAERP